jgi:2,4-dienoyl-CoA reductase-like NADH-dependent reductase (Old Yellow Enzyme family)
MMVLEVLAKPIQIGSRTAPNRLVNQSMECNDADKAGNPSSLTFDRYRKMSQGGAGIITVESFTVAPQSKAR